MMTPTIKTRMRTMLKHKGKSLGIGLLLLGLLLGGAGCGGGSGSGTPSSTPSSTTATTSGRAAITINWPHTTRVIPGNTDTIKLTFKLGGQPVQVFGTPTAQNADGTPVTAAPTLADSNASIIVSRPTNFGTVNGLETTTVVFSLPLGTGFSATASAFPNNSTTALATAATNFDVTSGDPAKPTRIVFDLASTVKSLVLTPAGPLQVAAGTTQAFTVTAKDASGNTLMVDTSRYAWTSSGGAAVTANKDTASVVFNNYTYKANVNIPATVVATFTEGNVTATASANVTVDATLAAAATLTDADPNVAGNLLQSGPGATEKSTAAVSVMLGGAPAGTANGASLTRISKDGKSVKNANLVSSLTQNGSIYTGTFTAPSGNVTADDGSTLAADGTYTLTFAAADEPSITQTVTIKVSPLGIIVPPNPVDQNTTTTLKASGVKTGNITFTASKGGSVVSALVLTPGTGISTNGQMLFKALVKQIPAANVLPADGAYAIHAVLTGAPTIAADATVTVNPITITLVSPASGATVTNAMPTVFTAKLQGIKPDGTVGKVQFAPQTGFRETQFVTVDADPTTGLATATLTPGGTVGGTATLNISSVDDTMKTVTGTYKIQ